MISKERALALREAHLESERVLDCLGLLCGLLGMLGVLLGLFGVGPTSLGVTAPAATVLIICGNLLRNLEVWGRNLVTALLIAWLVSALIGVERSALPNAAAWPTALVWVLWRAESSFVFSREYQSQVLPQTQDLVRPQHPFLIAAIVLGPVLTVAALAKFFELTGAIR